MKVLLFFAYLLHHRLLLHAQHSTFNKASSFFFFPSSLFFVQWVIVYPVFYQFNHSIIFINCVSQHTEKNREKKSEPQSTKLSFKLIRTNNIAEKDPRQTFLCLQPHTHTHPYIHGIKVKFFILFYENVFFIFFILSHSLLFLLF